MMHTEPEGASQAGQQQTLECLVCGLASSILLDDMQVLALEEEGALAVFCTQCQRPTFWKRTAHQMPAAPEPPPADDRDSLLVDFHYWEDPQTQSQQAPDRRGIESRRHKRVRLEQPIRVRVEEGEVQFEEVATTINVSRSGVYFESDKPYEMGMRVKANLNYSPDLASAIDHDYEVVRVDRVQFERRCRVALHLLS